MVNGDATGFEPISSLAFFHTLRKHTSEGMFSDPAYGATVASPAGASSGSRGPSATTCRRK